MDTRQNILAAAKALFWEKGYEATSPRDILGLSGAGQGSFYYHFHSKKDLAAEAIDEVVNERIQQFEAALSAEGSLKQRITVFLDQRKEALKGCRVGRMVWDSAVKDEQLRRPLERYFRHLERRLTEEIDAAAVRGEVTLLIPPKQLALLILAVVQGGFTISRATQAGRIDEAVEGLKQLAKLVILNR
jgi:AcrR family transcriptional regulator